MILCIIKMMRQSSLNNKYTAQFIAGFTDSIARNVQIIIAHLLLTNEYTQHIFSQHFKSATHIYWSAFYIFVFNLLNEPLWGNSIRNSVLYIHSLSIYNHKIWIIVLIQYLSAFCGLLFILNCIETISPSSKLQSVLVQAHDIYEAFDAETYLTFICQTLLYQFGDLFVCDLLRILENRNAKLIRSIYRIAVMNYLLINDRYLVLSNPNYAFCACLYHWRWHPFDFIILFSPIWIVALYKVFVADNAHKIVSFLNAIRKRPTKTQLARSSVAIDTETRRSSRTDSELSSQIKIRSVHIVNMFTKTKTEKKGRQ